MTKAAKWRTAVFAVDLDPFEDYTRCAALRHDFRCRGFAQHAHHIVYRSHLDEAKYWIVGNGIALSRVCHDLAHETHNGNLPPHRIEIAQRAVE